MGMLFLKGWCKFPTQFSEQFLAYLIVKLFSFDRLQNGKVFQIARMIVPFEKLVENVLHVHKILSV
jgi:hypothetical protein